LVSRRHACDHWARPAGQRTRKWVRSRLRPRTSSGLCRDLRSSGTAAATGPGGAASPARCASSTSPASRACPRSSRDAAGSAPRSSPKSSTALFGSMLELAYAVAAAC
jgi:hypothetical protein